MSKKGHLVGSNLVQIIRDGKQEAFIAQLEQLRADEEADRDRERAPKSSTGWFWQSSPKEEPSDEEKEPVPVIVGLSAEKNTPEFLENFTFVALFFQRIICVLSNLSYLTKIIIISARHR